MQLASEVQQLRLVLSQAETLAFEREVVMYVSVEAGDYFFHTTPDPVTGRVLCSIDSEGNIDWM